MRVPMGGQCDHCGRTSTPCWRKGPPEKPCLCNACGVRWLVKHSLEGYMPAVKTQVLSSSCQAAVVSAPSDTKRNAAAVTSSERGLRKRKDRSSTPDDTTQAKVTLCTSRSSEQTQPQQRGSNSKEEGEGDVFFWEGAAQQLESDCSQQQQGPCRQQRPRQERRRYNHSATVLPSSKKHRQYIQDQQQQQAARVQDHAGVEQYDMQTDQQYTSTSFNLEQYELQYALMADLELAYGSLDVELCGGGGGVCESSEEPLQSGGDGRGVGMLPLFSAMQKTKMNEELMADLADAASSLALLHRTSRHLFARPHPLQAPRRPRKQARPVACC